MNSVDDNKSAQVPVLAQWVEPEIRVLSVAETANDVGVGGDGGVGDCSFS